MRTCLPQATRQVADDARELAPDVADRLHPGLHHPLLQLGGDQVEPLRRSPRNPASSLRGGELEDLVAGEHQLADEVHQLVEQADVDPDVGAGYVVVAAPSGPLIPNVGAGNVVAAAASGPVLGRAAAGSRYVEVS